MIKQYSIAHGDEGARHMPHVLTVVLLSFSDRVISPFFLVQFISVFHYAATSSKPETNARCIKAGMR